MKDEPEPPPRFPPARTLEPRHDHWGAIRNTAVVEYPDVAGEDNLSSSHALPPIFISARFRSGSTLLWNLLRQMPSLTTYYEPLHPTLQRPPEERLRAQNDSTHVGVNDYWSEYKQVANVIGQRPESWDCEDLYLDASAWKLALANYLQLLLRSATSRPVLQFNRAYFRLAWLRNRFPEAKIVHLYRHPRDQWLSVLRDPTAFGPHDPVEQFIGCDHFFLLPWAHDLSAQFPVLDWELVEHPYQMHYLLWKLSYLWGQTYSDLSFSYEQLLATPQSTLGNLFDLLSLDHQRIADLTRLIRPQPPCKWRVYAPDSWFTHLEHRAEQMLDTLFGPRQNSTSAVRHSAA